MESSVAADFDVLAGQMLAGKQALILKGFNIVMTGAIGAPAPSLKLRVADGLLMHYQASEAGSVFWAPSDRADEQLSNNTKVTGSFTASQTNFIGLDLSRNADDSTSDNVQFLEPVGDTELSKVVPLARTLDIRIVVGTSDFSSQPSVLPLAKVVTDANNNVTSVQDARNMMFRLATGGDAPNIQNAYPWPGTRYENTAGDVFTGGDKVLNDLKTWANAVMTRFWELGGGEYWYSTTADRNVNMVWIEPAFSNGENFEVVGSNVHWKGLRFLFDNSTSFANDVQDQITDSPGLTDMTNGDCLYIDLDRTKFRGNAWVIATLYAVGDLVINDGGKAYMCRTSGTSAGSGGPTGTGTGINDNGVIWDYVGLGSNRLIAQKAPLISMGSPTTPGSRQVVAWMVGGSLYTRMWRYPVGTLFIPATYTSQGVIKISRDYLGNDIAGPSGLDNPIALSDRGGTIYTPTIGKVGLLIRRFESGASMTKWQTASGSDILEIQNDGSINYIASPMNHKIAGVLAGVLSTPSGTSTDWSVKSPDGNNLIQMFSPNTGGSSGFSQTNGSKTAVLRILTATNVQVGTTSNDDFDTITNNTVRWRVDKTTGSLTAIGAVRQISNIKDPVSAQDATTKNYVDTQNSLDNLFQTFLPPRYTPDTVTGFAVPQFLMYDPGHGAFTGIGLGRWLLFGSTGGNPAEWYSEDGGNEWSSAFSSSFHSATGANAPIAGSFGGTSPMAVVVGNSGNIVTAPTPYSTWTSRTNPIAAGGVALTDILWDANLSQWVASGQAAGLLTGTANGVTWTAQSPSIGTGAIHVCYDPVGQIYVAVCADTSSSTVVAKSSDAATWFQFVFTPWSATNYPIQIDALTLNGNVTYFVVTTVLGGVYISQSALAGSWTTLIAAGVIGSAVATKLTQNGTYASMQLHYSGTHITILFGQDSSFNILTKVFPGQTQNGIWNVGNTTGVIGPYGAVYYLGQTATNVAVGTNFQYGRPF